MKEKYIWTHKELLNLWVLSFVALLSKLGICDIDFFNFWLSPSQIVQNFEPIQKRLKFCSKLSKLPKVKTKVTKYNKIVWNQSIFLWNFVTYHKILVKSAKRGSFCLSFVIVIYFWSHGLCHCKQTDRGKRQKSQILS